MILLKIKTLLQLHKKMELSKTGQMGIEYHITLDM